MIYGGRLGCRGGAEGLQALESTSTASKIKVKEESCDEFWNKLYAKLQPCWGCSLLMHLLLSLGAAHPAHRILAAKDRWSKFSQDSSSNVARLQSCFSQCNRKRKKKVLGYFQCNRQKMKTLFNARLEDKFWIEQGRSCLSPPLLCICVYVCEVEYLVKDDFKQLLDTAKSSFEDC